MCPRGKNPARHKPNCRPKKNRLPDWRPKRLRARSSSFPMACHGYSNPVFIIAFQQTMFIPSIFAFSLPFSFPVSAILIFIFVFSLVHIIVIVNVIATLQGMKFL